MSQTNQGNKQSEKGMPKHEDRGQPKTVSQIDHVGSSGPHGIRFPVHNHPDLSVMTKGKLRE